MTSLTFLTNPVAGNWHPDDLRTFLGGNEESLTLLAQALARRSMTVRVYTSLRGPAFVADGVSWFPLESFNPDAERDVFVSWKNRDIWSQVLHARLKLHASQDVEPPLPSTYDYVLTLGSYHASRLPWIPPGMGVHAPLGIDTAVYRKPDGDAPRSNLALYATSPDRGLDQLLADWPTIRANHPGLGLVITYDWTRLETMSGPHGKAYADHLSRLAEQPGVSRRCLSADEMVRLFQRARYYIHPLPRPDADLFGFGALKAAACGCQLVLPESLANGFADTVDCWTPYPAFVAGETDVRTNRAWSQPALSWDEVVAQHWLPLMEQA